MWVALCKVCIAGAVRLSQTPQTTLAPDSERKVSRVPHPSLPVAARACGTAVHHAAHVAALLLLLLQVVAASQLAASERRGRSVWAALHAAAAGTAPAARKLQRHTCWHEIHDGIKLLLIALGYEAQPVYWLQAADQRAVCPLITRATTPVTCCSNAEQQGMQWCLKCTTTTKTGLPERQLAV